MAGRFFIVGGSLVVLMGGVHALLALADVVRPARFVPMDDTVRLAMKSTTMRFSGGRANMWDAWLGFNISHGAGLLLFGAAVVWAGANPDHLPVAKHVLAVPIAVGFIYCLLAVRFWFYAPVVGFAVATACFVAAWWSY